MNALRKISIDTVLLALAVALCVAGLVWLGGAHAWIAALGVGVFVAAQEAPQATKRPRCCATCSRPLDAWQLRFDGGAELRCGRYDCAAKDKLVATRDADGTIRVEKKALAEVENASQNPPPPDTDPAETAANHALTPLDLAALRVLAREASERAEKTTPGPWERWNTEVMAGPLLENTPGCARGGRGTVCRVEPDDFEPDEINAESEYDYARTDDEVAEDVAEFIAHARSDVPALVSAVDGLCDELEAETAFVKAILNRAPLDNLLSRLMAQRDEARTEIERLKAQRGLTSEEMAIIEAARALVRERDELRASVALLDEQGRKMKAERDAAQADLAHYTTLIRESAPDIDKALEGSKPPDLKDHNAWTIYAFVATLTGLRKMEESRTQERDDARAEIERMKPVVEAARSAERHITELEESSPINSGALIDLRAALETLDGGAT